ncbi:glycoside hydrolase family 65 protein [Companilactobacillus huachuanensis]|uniref:Glycoside hydrolase family 65 protein n=1 Tax=Companilactobacillus huachuanensis TaxID=2559914 RepID=A0ABW1RIM9_9LACO|nr:glycosyl hydrolase family 65 protein [Companilactobacillus huachuanensis]
MKPIYIKITDSQIIYANSENAIDEKSFDLDSNIELKQNLQEFKDSLSNLPNVIVITNPSKFHLKKNAILFHEEVIDLGAELENTFHIPVINIEEIIDSNLLLAAEKETDYASWHLDYYGLAHEKRQYGQESMQTIGNGYFGLRGTYLETKANDDNYPATYIAGVFDQLSTPINGRDIINEDLVNLPNAQYITFSINNGQRFTINESDIKESNRSLDLKSGLLTIKLLVQLDDGKELRIVEKKVADMQNYHDYYLQYAIEPVNFNGKITIYTQIDGTVVNSNVERYRNLSNKHLVIDQINNIDETAILSAHTVQSDIKLAIKTDLNHPTIVNPKYSIHNKAEIAEQQLEFTASAGETYYFEKDVSTYTSLETKEDIVAVAKKHQFLPSFADAAKQAQEDWQKVWTQEDVIVTGDITAQKLLRLNSYSMTTAAQNNANKDLDASVGSRGLTGEGYRGHIFWDELFDMNFYVLHNPELVKSLLMYRYNRLHAAMDYAGADGYNGAMYPWQSGLYGDEQSQEVHLNPITNKWDPDNSRKQRHVSLAIAYNVLNYFHLSHDEKFMQQFGLEMLLDIAKFWIDMSKLDKDTGKYTIGNVMGPDEFHEGYPGVKESGLKNNAYTNIMVSWLFKKIGNFINTESSDVLDNNFRKTNFSDIDIQKLDDIRHNLKLDFQGNILGQFEGYFDLKRLDFDKYRQQYGNISRMDRILKAHEDSPDNYQVAKQADTLMALFNLTDQDFFDILADLGYPITNPEMFIDDNVKYYIERTTHGSTLSRIVYSMLLLKADDTKTAWKLFYEALTSDYYDIQGGTTAEGIHLGVMGATLNLVTSFFAGIDYRGEVLDINPNMPKQWDEIEFKMNFKGTKFNFRINSDGISIKANRDTEVIFIGKKLPLVANQEIQLTY